MCIYILVLIVATGIILRAQKVAFSNHEPLTVKPTEDVVYLISNTPFTSACICIGENTLRHISFSLKF